MQLGDFLASMRGTSSHSLLSRIRPACPLPILTIPSRKTPHCLKNEGNASRHAGIPDSSEPCDIRWACSVSVFRACYRHAPRDGPRGHFTSPQSRFHQAGLDLLTKRPTVGPRLPSSCAVAVLSGFKKDLDHRFPRTLRAVNLLDQHHSSNKLLPTTLAPEGPLVVRPCLGDQPRTSPT
jgi:hypothetical protein